MVLLNQWENYYISTDELCRKLHTYLSSTEKWKVHESDWNLNATKIMVDNKNVNQNLGFGYAFDIKCQTFGYSKFHFLIILSTQFS